MFCYLCTLTLWNCQHLPLLHQRSISLFAAVGPAMQVQTDGRTCGWTLCHFTDPAQHIMQAVPITSFIMGISSHQFSLIKTRLQLFYIVFLLCKQVASGFYCVRNTHTHTCFNGPFSGTTQVSQYQKDKSNLDFTGARDSEWRWPQLGHMQVCILLQTDNHASTPPLCFLQAGCPSCRPTNRVKALFIIVTKWQSTWLPGERSLSCLTMMSMRTLASLV